MKPNRLATTLLIILIGITTLSWAKDEAMVMDISGPPPEFQDGEKAGQEVMLMDFVSDGDTIQLPSGTRMVLNFFESRAREEISGPGLVLIGPKGAQGKDDAVVKSSVVEFVPAKTTASKADSQHVGAVAMRGLGTNASQRAFPLQPRAVDLISPNLTAVREPEVHFEWRSLPGAQSYALTVSDQLGRVVHHTETDAPQITLDPKVLKPGLEYSWKVEAMSGQAIMAVGESKFFVLSPDKRTEIAYVEKYIKENYPPRSTEASIALALLFKKYELNDEAKALLRSLQKAHPLNTNITRQLRELTANYRQAS